MKKSLTAVLLAYLAFAAPVFSTPLSVVNVSAPAVNCVFDASCTIIVSDTTASVPLAATGTNFLQSRTFTGNAGAPANGLYGYYYRIDLRNAVSAGSPSCVRSLTLKFGPVVSTLDYNGDGNIGDQVLVVTGGGLGSVAPVSADQDAAGNITFTFDPAVCAGTSPGTGQSTYFFGLASTQAPAPVTATVTETGGAVHEIGARAPQAGAACSIPPYSPSYWNDCDGLCSYHCASYTCGTVHCKDCAGCTACGSARCNNNCYNYANNKRTDTFAQPGCAAGSMATTMSCAVVRNAALADGLAALPVSGTCEGGMDKVALVVAPGYDYHWYRLGSDNMWTHKPGSTAATNLDNSGHTISNPETADRGWYTDFCGYLCTCSDASQGQGRQNIK